MEQSKVHTYLGFCIRAGKIVYGMDNIAETKKRVHLLIADCSISENSFKNLLKEKERLGCPLLTTEKSGQLEELLHRPSVKAVAIKDKNLAAAILSVAGSGPKFNLYSGGNN